MDYLVTGATGFLGNNIVRDLLARGQTVRVLIRQNSDSRPLHDLAVERVIGDVCSKRDVDRAMRDCSHVIHAAASVAIGWTGMESARAINVNATQHIADSAIASGARMVFVSSVDALAPSIRKRPVTEDTPYRCKVPCTYVVTKREAELNVLQKVSEGLDAIIVNPGFMLGPFDWRPSSGRMLLDVAKKFSPFAPPGGMSICDVRDVVAGIFQASQTAPSGRRFILAGHNLKFRKVWQLFSTMGGTIGPVSPFGPLIARGVGAIGDIRTKVTGEESPINSAMLRMSCLNHYYSSDRAMSELGYQIRPVEQIVGDAWKWFQENGYA